MIGRPVSNDKRELVIGRRSHGYVALHRYLVEVDTVLALRSPWQAGYAERTAAAAGAAAGWNSRW